MLHVFFLTLLPWRSISSTHPVTSVINSSTSGLKLTAQNFLCAYTRSPSYHITTVYISSHYTTRIELFFIIVCDLSSQRGKRTMILKPRISETSYRTEQLNKKLSGVMHCRTYRYLFIIRISSHYISSNGCQASMYYGAKEILKTNSSSGFNSFSQCAQCYVTPS